MSLNPILDCWKEIIFYTSIIKKSFLEESFAITKKLNEGVRSIFLNRSLIKSTKYVLLVILHLFIVYSVEIVGIFVSICITNNNYSDLEIKNEI